MRLTCLVLVALLAGCLGRLDPGVASPQDGAAPGASNAYAGVSGSPPSGDERAAEQDASTRSPAAHPNATARGPPAPMHWEGSATIGIEAGSPWGTCAGPFNSCDQRPFGITGTFDVDATLSWDPPGNDLDLFLYRHTDAGDTLVSSEGVNGPTEPGWTQQVLHHADLPSGDYRFWVVPRHGVDVKYTLDAVFS